MNWGLQDIVTATGGRLLYGGPDQCFDGIGIDSRIIASGALFVAIQGASHDAHKFLPQVVAKGVRGIVVHERAETGLEHAAWQAQGVACVAVQDTTRALGALAAFQRDRMQIPVVAVTGSNGKTTTRRMTAQVLSQRLKTLATEGNLNNEIGVPLTLFRLTAEHQAAVVELGMNHAGEIDRLAAICRPTIGMITNVGPAHLEFLGSLQGVARAKGELLAHIAADGHVILNRDDAHLCDLAQRAPVPVLFFGTHPEADVRAEAVCESAEAVSFELVLPGGRLAVRLSTPGRFMVLNALAAAAAGHLAGVPIEAIKAGLESFRPGHGRLSVKATANGVHIIDDTYNANPASMAVALQTLAALKGERRGFIVFGEMLELGEQADALHHQVGTLAGRSGAVKLYACGAHAGHLLAGARQAGMAPEQLVAAAKEEIAADLTQVLAPGDWLLVKGSRGMAMETVVSAIEQWAQGSGRPPESRSTKQ
jgi:UDP-N-acetylmuramoyl-tripeptide--D-alanyl-D-alanine ligase